MSNEITKDEIAEFRGGYPAKCSFCDKETAPENLEPEEAGAWVCRECIARWDEQDRVNDLIREAGAQAERERILKIAEEIDKEMENAEEVSAEAYNDGVEVFLRALKQRLGGE